MRCDTLSTFTLSEPADLRVQECTETCCALQTDHRKRCLAKHLQIFVQVLDLQFQVLPAVREKKQNCLPTFSSGISSPFVRKLDHRAMHRGDESRRTKFLWKTWLPLSITSCVLLYDDIPPPKLKHKTPWILTRVFNILQNWWNAKKRRGLIFRSDGVCS